MSIVTRTGDGGMTSLFSGERVWKDDLRIETFGTVDELSSALGLARHAVTREDVRAAIDVIQRDLVRLGGELASRGKPVAEPLGAAEEEGLDARIEELEREIVLRGFVIPGMTEASARLDLARTIARRAERRLVALAREAEVPERLRRYLNRLSDLLFMLARAEEAAAGAIRYV